jgi:hypothetical protein
MISCAPRNAHVDGRAQIVMRYLTVRRYPHRSAPRSRRYETRSHASVSLDPAAPTGARPHRVVFYESRRS